MAVYKNDERGRSLAIVHIKSLVEKGYARKNIEGVCVQLAKIIKQGKFCYVVEYVEFRHNSTDETIEVKQLLHTFNAQKAKDELYGFSSPYVECKNAVKAGLFNEVDVEVLRSEYTEKEWFKRD